ALDLSHHLVNVAVEYRHAAESLEVGESLRAILGAPSPLGIHRPEWNVREDHHRPARGLALQIGFQPCELIRAKTAQAFQHSHVRQAYEMDVLVIEAVPAVALRGFAVSLQVLFAVVDREVMLARDVEHLP